MSAAGLGGWAVAGVALAVALLLRRSFARRMEAVARACHEVRGPLTAIALGISLSGRGGELSPGRERAMQTELRRAALALRDLADVPRRRSPAGRGDAQRVSLAGLVGDAVTAAEGRAADADVLLEQSWDGADAVVWGDRLRLAQALGNLLANAIEHGGGVVRVRGAVRGAQARVEIADDGPGLPAPVATLARRPRGGRGSRGRGLAIAMSIAQRHGGSLVTAPAPRGAVVVLTLPALAAGRDRPAGGRPYGWLPVPVARPGRRP